MLPRNMRIGEPDLSILAPADENVFRIGEGKYSSAIRPFENDKVLFHNPGFWGDRISESLSQTGIRL
jgi:hypothetical protein